MPLCPPLVADLAPGLCVAVDIYCERTTPALDAEPLNAVSNLSFLAAAAFGWRLLQRVRPSGAGLIQALIAVAVAIGFGSGLFHTVATRWAAWADVIPILIFILLYLWLALTRFFRWPWWLVAAALAAFLIVTLYGEAIIPPTVLRGGAMYVPALLAMLATAAALLPRRPAAGRAMFAAVGVFAVSFAARTLDMPFCASWPIGTHFLWHLLNGLLIYLLMRIAILHAPRAG